MRKKSKLKERILTLLREDKKPREIAAQLGCKPQYVRNVRWQAANPDLYRRLHGEANLRIRRERGVRPRGVAIAAFAAECRKHTKNRYRAIEPLLAKGLSFTQAGERLGLTKGQIAGVRWRAQLRDKKLAQSNQEARP